MNRPKLTLAERAHAAHLHAAVRLVRAYDVILGAGKQRPDDADLRKFKRAEKRLELAAAEYVGARLEEAGALTATLAVLRRSAEARHEYPTRKRRPAAVFQFLATHNRKKES